MKWKDLRLLLLLMLLLFGCSSPTSLTPPPARASPSATVSPTLTLTVAVTAHISPTLTPSPLPITSSTSSTLPAGNQPPTLDMFSWYGVNLAGAEFGDTVPGIEGTHYTYPDCPDMQIWHDQGIYFLRYPVRYERIMEDKTGLLTALDCAETMDMGVIVDLHNYLRIKEEVVPTLTATSESSTSPQIADTPTPFVWERRLTAQEVASFWQELAGEIKDKPALAGYDIMNEPFDEETTPYGYERTWKQVAQVTIDAIRTVDTTTPIIVQGNCWASAWRWIECSDELKDLHDPEDRLVFSAHQYFDGNASGAYVCGTASECGAKSGMAEERLSPFVEWCNLHDFHCFVGEMGFPVRDDGWKIVADEAIVYLRENEVGLTLWSAGPWWGEYLMSLELPEAQWLVDLLVKE